MPEMIGDSIDRLCAIEMRFKPAAEGSLPRGVMTPLFEAARRAAGEPMSLLAAKTLVDNVRPGDRVFVLCGSGSPPYLPHGETDGPLGGAAIARALDLGLGAKPIVISEAHMMPPNRAAVAAAGLAIHDEDLFAIRPHSSLTIEFPSGMHTRADIDALFDHHQPACAVFVERTGPNADGIFHSITGTPKDPDEIIANHLFVESARERNIPTIGIGDGGNEIGFGKVYEEARAIQLAPVAITVVETDVLVAAAISNWGAYGVAAMLGYLLETPKLVQEPEMEYRMLQAATAAGAADGIYTSPTMFVDGTSWRIQQALVTMLAEIVRNGLTPMSREF